MSNQTHDTASGNFACPLKDMKPNEQTAYYEELWGEFEFDCEWAKPFLTCLAHSQTIASALKRLKELGISITRRRVEQYRNENAQFKEAFGYAKAEFFDRITEAACKLGIEGVIEPVYQGGERVGYKRVYSAAVLVTMMKQGHPEFNTTHVETTNTNTNRNLNLNTDLSDEEMTSKDAAAVYRHIIGEE